jgi:hypothetical protein
MQSKIVRRSTFTSKEVEEYTFTKDELQHIVDIYFEVIIASLTNVFDHNVTKDQFYKNSGMGEDGLRNKYMATAARHLRESCGIDTTPMGLSWGVIKSVK